MSGHTFLDTTSTCLPGLINRIVRSKHMVERKIEKSTSLYRVLCLSLVASLLYIMFISWFLWLLYLSAAQSHSWQSVQPGNRLTQPASLQRMRVIEFNLTRADWTCHVNCLYCAKNCSFSVDAFFHCTCLLLVLVVVQFCNDYVFCLLTS